MPVVYTLLSVEDVQSQADLLLRAGGRLADAAAKMKQSGLPEAYLVWSEASFEAAQRIAGATVTAHGMIVEQVEAKNAGQPNPFEKLKKRAARQIANRKARQARDKDAPRSDRKSKGAR